MSKKKNGSVTAHPFTGEYIATSIIFEQHGLKNVTLYIWTAKERRNIKNVILCEHVYVRPIVPNLVG
jgi:hypothetical protein